MYYLHKTMSFVTTCTFQETEHHGQNPKRQDGAMNRTEARELAEGVSWAVLRRMRMAPSDFQFAKNPLGTRLLLQSSMELIV